LAGRDGRAPVDVFAPVAMTTRTQALLWTDLSAAYLEAIEVVGLAGLGVDPNSMQIEVTISV